MQLFQVKDPNGNLIMNAPLEVIQRIWRINSHVLATVLKHTAKLDSEYVVHFAAEKDGWPKSLHIQRLPMEIPSVPDVPFGKRLLDMNTVEQRLAAAEKAWLGQLPENMTSETEFGELLSDE
jgi:hypothetical protein